MVSPIATYSSASAGSTDRLQRCLVALLWLALITPAQGSTADVVVVECEADYVEVRIPRELITSPIKVIDEHGYALNAHRIATKCGYTLSSGWDNTLVFRTTYYSCYVHEQSKGWFSFVLQVEGALLPVTCRRGAGLSPQTGGNINIWAVAKTTRNIWGAANVTFTASPTAAKRDKETPVVFTENIWPIHIRELKKTAGPPVVRFVTPDAGVWEIKTELPSVTELRPLSQGLQCGADGVPASECIRLGCAFDSVHHSPPCFYKYTGCSQSGHFVIMVNSSSTTPPLRLTTAHVSQGQGSQCQPKWMTSDLAVFHFPVRDCGSGKLLVGDSVLYETEIVADRELVTALSYAISRDSGFRLRVRCVYRASGAARLETIVNPPPAFKPISELGTVRLELRIAKGSSFSSWVSLSEFPLVRVLLDPVFVEVRIVDREDPSLELLLDNCWATSDPKPGQGAQWPLLRDRCPFLSDNYQTVLHEVALKADVKFPLHNKRFELKTFTFVNQTNGIPFNWQLYIHCSAVLCSPAGDLSCQTNCSSLARSRRRRLSKRSRSQKSSVVVSSRGSIRFVRSTHRRSNHRTTRSQLDHRPAWSVRRASALSIVSVSLLGVSLAIFGMQFTLRYRRNRHSVTSHIYQPCS
ncbi:zona pellucida sperm-binding protein 4-like [Acipenser oxyrinchus oxyrinchus]|uniref:Zona pellucida sperm-binding protein 4 n=1 Tax=Acipenser oxyrinchus oxyrinchus TaxID=40147 RepID=A0AAD8CK39_ACIOX|nr:zona pellucida sperm-binding protein 4-like [Acipenser oxyrinchus oxyrinchus]